MIKKLKKNRGFTILEVMIVVLIIGVLSLIAYPFYKNYMHKIRLTEVINDFVPLINSLRETVVTDEILPGFADNIYKYASHKTGDNNYEFMDKESMRKALGINPKYIKYLAVSIPPDYSHWAHLKESKNSRIRISIDYQNMYGVYFNPDDWDNHPPILYLSIDVAQKMRIDNETKSGLLTKCSVELYNDTAMKHFGLSFISALPDVCKSFRIGGGNYGVQFKSMQ